ncbi:PASTA domain-containing protein [Marinobacter sp.]|uniref:PASTA domain-containing protein n=1 Tax=Marinobacter sp. TaxID=50741 RepID=UPI003A904D0D
MSDLKKLAQDIGAAPLGDLIASVGRGVAEAQAALDAGSLEQCLALYENGDDLTRIMRETGYRPTFYAIPETEGELTLSLTVIGNSAPQPTPSAAPLAPLGTKMLNRRVAARPRIYAAPVDGGYRNSYGFTGTVGAKIKFRIVAVPAPSGAEAARVVPDFTGMTSAQATILAESFDLVLEGVDEANADAKIATQDPTPGAVVREDSSIAVTTG